MKVNSRLLGALLLLAVAGSSHGASVPNIVEWTLVDAWGKTVTVDPKGKPVLLFFWASWCPYCHKLMPFMQKIQDQYAEKGLLFYSINVWETGDPMAYMFEYEYEFPVLVEGEEMADRYGVKGTPGVLLFGRDGRLVYQRIGGAKPQGVYDALAVEIEKMLPQK